MDLYNLFNVCNSYCLLLDKRIDNWKEIQESFAKKNINLQSFLVGDGKLDGYKYSHVDVASIPPVYHNSINYRSWYRESTFNAWLSHRKIIQKSLEEGFDHVMIVEDDVFIEDDYDSILAKAAPFFKDNKWDMIYLGGYHNQDSWQLTTNENVIKLKGSGGWHAVILTELIMVKMLEFNPIGPMDWITGKYIHPDYDCYAIYPSIVSQKSGYSFVEESQLNKPSRYQR